MVTPLPVIRAALRARPLGSALRARPAARTMAPPTPLTTLSLSLLHSSARLHRAPVPNTPQTQSPITPRSGPSSSPGGTGAGQKKSNSVYTVWYRDIVPAMLPIFVLSTVIFLALSLVRTHLSHSKSLEESNERIAQLESQLARLRNEAKRRQERERRERERILPIVVERVLQRVGAMEQEQEDDVEIEDRLLV